MQSTAFVYTLTLPSEPVSQRLNLKDDLAIAFRDAISTASGVLIGSHLNPDGDTLGSALALSHYLDSLNVRNEVLCHHSPPENLHFLPGVERVRHAPKGKSFDLGILVDMDSPERLGSTEPYFDACPKSIVIDHHVPHHKPGDLRIVDENAAATAVILYGLFQKLEAPITPEIACCLLTGIVTDTGSFRFRNTNPEALDVAGSLVEMGGDINRIAEEVFHRKPLSSLRLLGILLAKMHVECSDRLAWADLKFEDFQAVNGKDEETEGFVNELLSIQTVQMAALFREPREGKVRVSLRSMGHIDVAEIAREFGGGGHKNAAGISFDGDIEDVVQSVVPRLRSCLESS